MTASQLTVVPSAVDWLLEECDPGVRYLALRDLVETDVASLAQARKLAHQHGPIAKVLSAMQSEGYWEEPGPGYRPKYRSTVWSLILLAQLGGAAQEDERIAAACTYLLDHAWHPHGQLSAGEAASHTIDCLQGNLCWALLELGCTDPRLEKSFEWLARTITGEGLAPKGTKDAEMRYYAYKCGPGFQCGANYELPCAWGAAKEMLALSRLPINMHTPLIDRAIQQGVDFLFSVDLPTADYPRKNEKPNRAWWSFGFPVFYVTDLLQVAEALVNLGYASDPRLAGLLELIRAKQDEQGRWKLEYVYGSKTWGNFGRKNQANKWVTLRALRVLTPAR
jgi:hypothetical protein